ncbi:MAG: FlgD immunoglobulin-like domain containing protein, partial [bacterium]
VYAGMDGTVIKTIDGGRNWMRTGLRDTLIVHFSGLALDPFTPEHLYACGRGSRMLWESIDAGMTWQKIVPMFSLAGITRIVADPNAPGVIYFATAGNGVWRYQSDMVAVKDRHEEALPKDFVLEQNYPNPFSTEGRSPAIGGGNRGTVIRFEIPLASANSPARLAIYNLHGELIRELINRRLPAGDHITRWDGKDDTGREVASGIYLYRLQTGYVTEMRKLSFVK